MSATLRTIVYVSTAIMPTDAASIEALLVEARDLNLDTRTTGLLLLCGGSFMQCIEGSGSGFDETWDRIRLSRKHTQLITLIDEPIEARDFHDWQMAYFGPTESDLLAASTERWKLESRLDCPAGAPGRELLQQFWGNRR